MARLASASAPVGRTRMSFMCLKRTEIAVRQTVAREPHTAMIGPRSPSAPHRVAVLALPAVLPLELGPRRRSSVATRIPANRMR